MKLRKILLIQTAFIGDVILATALIEKLRQFYPHAQLDFLLRQGNEGLLKDHPYLNRVLIWNKKKNKHRNLLQLIFTIRQEKYDVVINLQRFASTGLFTAFSGAPHTVGFDKNPFSRLFSHTITHRIGDGTHEVERNLALIEHLTDSTTSKPKLYPSTADFEKVAAYQQQAYICIAPTSVWFTKQFPEEKWVELLQRLPDTYRVYVLGSPADKPVCSHIIEKARRYNVVNLAGELSLLASAALMEGAVMNYVNDSAPMHLASAMNAPTSAIYCSTIPAFGFGPLADQSYTIELEEPLYCRPCGLHGHKSCPEGHFHCAKKITIDQLLKTIQS